jgi:antagonist of KipI
MDSYSHRLANALVGNPPGAATIEATIVGPALEFDDDRVVAVSGGDFDVKLDGLPAPVERAFDVHHGSRLSVGRRGAGARAYIAVCGGIAVAPVLGSRATHVLTHIGGLGGRPLKTGDRLALGDRVGARGAASPHPARPGGDSTRLRVLPGVHRPLFSDDAFAALLSNAYRVGQDSDRVGFRLEGKPIPHVSRADMISEATPMGTVQIAGSGLPILLMADRQTTGGYPQLATVIAADLPIAGQLGPGDALTFVSCLPGEAIAALVAREQLLMGIERVEAM